MTSDSSFATSFLTNLSPRGFVHDFLHGSHSTYSYGREGNVPHRQGGGGHGCEDGMILPLDVTLPGQEEQFSQQHG